MDEGMVSSSQSVPQQEEEKAPWWTQTEGPDAQQAPADVQYMREALVSAASQMLYTDQGMEATIGQMQAGQDPMDAAAKMTGTIMSASSDKLRNGGVEVNQDALFSAGREVLERIITLGKAAGALNMGETEVEIQQSMDATAEKALGYYQKMQQGPQQQQGPAQTPQEQADPQQGQVAPGAPIIGGA